MRLAIGTILAVAAVAQAQTLTDLPKCAQDCVGNSLSSTGCNSINVPCICGSTEWISGLSCCVLKTCNNDDQAKTITFAQNICSSVGKTVPNNAAAACAAKTGGNSTSSASSASTPSSTGTSSASSSASSTAAAPKPSSSGSFGNKEVAVSGVGFLVVGMLGAAIL